MAASVACPAFLHQRFHFALLLVGLLAVSGFVNSAPRTKSKASPPTVYDQKQTGDYNIQLHLKDFQIIAVLADDSLGELGDYDYNYDYSDFTVKPGASSTTTTKPTLNETSPQPQNSDKPSTIKPSNGHPYPILQPSNQISNSNHPTSKPTQQEVTVLAAKPQSTTTTSTTTTVAPNKNEIAYSTTTTTSTTTTKNALEIVENNTQKLLQLGEENSNLTPDKIKVQIIQAGGGEPNLGIVPSEDVIGDDDKVPGVQLGEILHYRRCASGYARDKRGRCRKVRRPVSHMPFGIGRIASNLAARLRSAPLGEDAGLNQDSIEK